MSGVRPPRNLLCQDGVFNAGTSEFIASDGSPRWGTVTVPLIAKEPAWGHGHIAPPNGYQHIGKRML